MVFKVKRGSDRVRSLSEAVLRRRGWGGNGVPPVKAYDALETTVSFHFLGTEEDLYKFFVLAVKSKFHLSAFIDVVPPSLFAPGTVYHAPPAPFEVEGEAGDLTISVTAILDWRSIYVLASSLARAAAWVLSAAGQRVTLTPKTALKARTFEEIFLLGTGVIRSRHELRHEHDEPEPEPVAPAHATISDE